MYVTTGTTSTGRYYIVSPHLQPTMAWFSRYIADTAGMVCRNSWDSTHPWMTCDRPECKALRLFIEHLSYEQCETFYNIGQVQVRGAASGVLWTLHWPTDGVQDHFIAGSELGDQPCWRPIFPHLVGTGQMAYIPRGDYILTVFLYLQNAEYTMLRTIFKGGSEFHVSRVLAHIERVRPYKAIARGLAHLGKAL